jgi:hypothetical protein
VTESSNPVEVDVPEKISKPRPEIGVEPFCQSKPGPLLGVSGSRRGWFTARISAKAVRRVTFYLDGRKLKALSAAQARGGKFAVRINAKRLRPGTHRVSAAVVMSESVCPKAARAAVFVRPARIVLPEVLAG